MSGCSARSAVKTADTARSGWIPNSLTVHPWPAAIRQDSHVCPLALIHARGHRGVSLGNRDQSGPHKTKGPAVSDKSPRQAMSKKSGKSLKEKRADKNAKSAAKLAASESITDLNKRR